MDASVLLDLLKVEHQLIRDKINQFDEDRARLKGWMITASAGLTALSITARQWPLLVLVLLSTLFFALAELALISVQEAVIARSAQIEGLIDMLLHNGVSPEHTFYEFGMAKTFQGDKWLKWVEVKSWVSSRTFNPYLYVGLIIMPALVLAIGIESGTF